MEEEYPMMAYHYLVEIDGTEVRFQEVSGLEVEIEYSPYRSGDNGTLHTINVAGMQKYTGTLICKKGIFEEDEELMEFMTNMLEEKEFYDEDSKFDISVELLNATGETVMAWMIEGCAPKKLSAPSFNSMENAIAVETMEFSYDSFTVSSDGS